MFFKTLSRRYPLRGYFLGLNIKTGPASTATRCQRVIHNLELTPNQLHRIIDLAPLQQLQARPIHDHLRALLALEDRVVLVELQFLRCYALRGGVRSEWLRSAGVDGRDAGEGHQVLEAVAAARLDGYAQGEVGVLVFGHYLFETLGFGVSTARSGFSYSLGKDETDRAQEGWGAVGERTFAARGVISTFMSFPSSSLRGL